MSREIHDLLGDLRRLQGVHGAAVVTTDGMLAAADLDDRFDQDAIAGLVSFFLTTANRALAEMSGQACTQFTMHTTHGKVLMASADQSSLVVITDQFTNLATITADFDDAIRRLRRISRISI